MTSISVALATYNGEQFLREQLDSLAGQSVLPVELVVCDDSSSDSTCAIVQAFARSAPFPVRLYVNEQRLGYKSNFMQCISRCSGDLIALCDQDDVWLSYKLEKQGEVFSDPQILLSCHNAELIDENGASMGRKRNPVPGRLGRLHFADLEPFAHYPGFALMFRRNLTLFSQLWLLSKNEFCLKEQTSHDRWVFFLASVFGFVHIDAASLAAYRQHASNTSGHAHRIPFIQRLGSTVQNRYDEYERMSATAANRVDLLNTVLTNPPLGIGENFADFERRATEALSKYAGLAASLGRRRNLYRNQSARERIGAFLSLIRNRDYRLHDDWSFSAFGFGLDLTILFAGHRWIRTELGTSARL